MTEQFAPPICARIRATRERLRKEALERGDKKAAREFTQQRLAEKLHLSLGGYSAYERFREPDYFRRQEIARALGLDSEYFEYAEMPSPQEGLEGLREEVAALREEWQEFRDELRKSRPAG